MIALLPAKRILASFLPSAMGLPQHSSLAKITESARCKRPLSRADLHLQFGRAKSVPAKVQLKKVLLNKRRKNVLKKIITNRHAIERDDSKIASSALFTRGGSSKSFEPKSKDRKINQHSSLVPKKESKGHSKSMYLACMSVVLVW